MIQPSKLFLEENSKDSKSLRENKTFLISLLNWRLLILKLIKSALSFENQKTNCKCQESEMKLQMLGAFKVSVQRLFQYLSLWSKAVSDHRDLSPLWAWTLYQSGYLGGVEVYLVSAFSASWMSLSDDVFGQCNQGDHNKTIVGTFRNVSTLVLQPAQTFS